MLGAVFEQVLMGAADVADEHDVVVETTAPRGCGSTHSAGPEEQSGFADAQHTFVVAQEAPHAA